MYSIFYCIFSLNIMFRVSFSPGRERACRHCWIFLFFSFWTLWVNKSFREYLNTKLNILVWTIPENLSSNLESGDLGVNFFVVVFNCIFQPRTTYNNYNKKHFLEIIEVDLLFGLMFFTFSHCRQT